MPATRQTPGPIRPVAYSDNGGQSWTEDPNTKWPGNSNFGQVSMVQPGDGYVYLFGIPRGRYGPPAAGPGGDEQRPQHLRLPVLERRELGHRPAERGGGHRPRPVGRAVGAVELLTTRSC